MTENKGLTTTPVASMDLGAQIDGTRGRQFRVRKIGLEPGGVFAVHSHKDRPAFAYIVEGTLIEHRQGSPVKEYHAGEVITETTDVTHWAENKGTKPVIVIAVDIFKP